MRKKTVVLTTAQREQLLREASTTTLTRKQLAERYNVSTMTVNNIFDRAKFPRKHSNTGAHKRMTAEKRCELEARLRESSDTDVTVAKDYGVTHQRVAQIRMKLGLPNVRNPESKVYQAKKVRREQRIAKKIEKGEEYRRNLEEKRRERLTEIKEMWDRGCQTSEIAASLDTTPAMLGQWMVHLRKRYPGELKLRRPCYYRGKPK